MQAQYKGLVKQIEEAAVAAGYRLLQVEQSSNRKHPSSAQPTHWLVKPAAAKPIRIKTTTANASNKLTAKQVAKDGVLVAAGFTVTTVTQLSDATALLV